MFPADRTTLGFFPFQHHEDGVPLVVKQAVYGARVNRTTGTEVGWDEPDGKSSVGDLHGWRHWLPETRAIGSWSPVYAVIGTEGGAATAPVPEGTAGSMPGQAGALGAPGGAGGGGPGGAGVGSPAAPGSPSVFYPQGTGVDRSSASNSAFIGQGGRTLSGSGTRDIGAAGLFGARSRFSRFSGGGTGHAYSVWGQRVAGSGSGFGKKKNGAKKADNGQVAAWFGKKGGSDGVGNSRKGDITGGDDYPNVFVANPIGDDAYRADGTYKSVAHALPEFWPAFPTDIVGVALAGSVHTRQDNLFLPTDPRMFAPNVGGDPAQGSWVVDLTPQGRADCTGPDPTSDGRAAPLQSVFRVVRLADDAGSNGIAWQLAPSALDGRCGLGLVYGATMDREASGAAITPGTGGGATVRDPITGATTFVPGLRSAGSGVGQVFGAATPSGSAAALMAQEAGGPLALGSAKDRHAHGTTKDGEVVNAGHLHTGALFHHSAEYDAPLDFEARPIPKTSGHVYPTKVHLVYDPNASHDFNGKKIPGLWRLYTTVPHYESGGPERPRPTTPTPSLPPQPKRPRPPGDTTPGDPGTPTQPPRPPGDITPGSGDPSLDGGGDWDWHRFFNGEDETGGRPGLFSNEGMPWLNASIGTPDATKGYTARDYHLMTPTRQGFASLIARPQDFAAGAVDMRGKVTAPNADDEWARPAVVRAEAFGKSSGVGAWGYTHTPTNGRTGTAPGGIAYFAPEVDMVDAASTFAPVGVTKSQAYAAVYTPGVRTAYGLPDTTTGGVKTAVEEYGDAGDLVWAAVDGSGTSAEKMRLTAGGLLTFEGESANEPALRKGGTAILEVRTGNNGAQASLEALTFRVAGAQVVGAMKNGWTAPSGTASRAGFDPATVTTEELAQRVHALIDDMFVSTGHGLIGP